MSADSRDNSDDHADCWGMDPESARRQFNVSAVLGAVLALAALLVAVLGPVATVNVHREAAQTIVQAPQFKHIQRAEGTIRPGG
jgi:hypothetical protein